MFNNGFALIVSLALWGLPAVVNADPGDWDERSFVGNTRYSFSQHNGTEVIKGETTASASVLYRRESVDLIQHPVLRWRWKINNSYGSEINEQSKSGDDYPARVYVVVKTGIFPWQTLAVNYVWSSSGQVGDTWPSPYTQKSQMLALQAGDQKARRWINERRDVVADFKRFFDIDVSTLEGYAIMVDGDNSGSTGTAWFSHIEFGSK